MRRLAALSVVALALMAAACNTIEGAGRDLSAAGHAVSRTAQDAK